MAKNEAKIKFTAETGEFNQAIKQTDNKMSELRAEMKLNETQMKATGTTVEGLENKHEILAAQLKASESKTEALSNKHKKAVEIFGENSEEAHKLKVQLLNAQNAEEKLKQSVSACEKEISELSNELEGNKRDLDKAEKSAEELDKSYDELGDGAGNVGEKMKVAAAGIAALAAGAVAFGNSAIEAFNEVDEGADNVVRATGATGEAAEELAGVYEDVASQVVGSFDEMGSMVGEINTRFGYTGEKLETTSIKFQKFADITGMDATEAVQSVTRAMNDAGIPLEEYDGLLDQLAKAGQAAGIDVATMTDMLSKNGATMRAMGFDTEETIALLSQFELSGADTTTMLSGMKKAFATWSDAGKDGKKEFSKLVKGIKDGSISASDAMDVFGTKAGPQLVDAIKSGKFEYEDMLKVIQDSKGTVEGTFDETVDGGYQMELAFQNCKMAMAEAGDVLATALAPAFQSLSENIIPKAVDIFHSFVEKITDAVKWMKEHKGVVIAIASVIGILTAAITAYNIVQGIKAAMEAANVTTVWALVAAHIAQAAAAMAAIAPYVLIVAAIAAVIAIIVLCVKHWDKIKEVTKKVWEAIKNFVVNATKAVKEAISKAWEAIKKATTVAWNAVKNAIVAIWEGIKKAAKAVWDGIKKIFTAAVDLIKNIMIARFNLYKKIITTVWDAIKKVTTTVWNAIKKVVTSIVDAVKNGISKAFNAVKNTISNIWNGVKNTTKNVWNSIKSTITNMVTKVKSTVSNAFSGVSSKISTVWNKIKNAMTNPIEAARSTLSKIVGKIKSLFNFSWSIPKPKIPKFSVSGGKAPWGFGGKGKLPSISVKWNAAGGILTKPTIFGATGNTLLGGGEAGPEAILPIDKLEGYVENAVEKTMQTVNMQPLVNAIERMADRAIELNINGRQFATATAGDVDNVNGLRSSFISRGLILE